MPTESFTTQQAAEQITRGNYSWGSSIPDNSITVTYAFRDQGLGALGETLIPIPQEGMELINQSLALWSDVCNIQFQRVDDGDGYSNNATILFGSFEDNSSPYAAYELDYADPNQIASNLGTGDVWFNLTYTTLDIEGSDDGYYFPYQEWQTVLHEIGHSIGLMHPGDYNAGDPGTISYADDALYIEDDWQYTVMSYFYEQHTGADFSGMIQMPMLHDIAAAQRLYGVNMSTRTGDDVYGYNVSANLVGTAFDMEAVPYTQIQSTWHPVWCVWDAGGIDTFDFSGEIRDNIIDLRAEHFSSINRTSFFTKDNVSIAAGVVIENAFGGTGDDIIWGNEVANLIVGYDGHDIIRGLEGQDTLNGGADNDTFIFTTLADSTGSAPDWVGFRQGQNDKINLSQIDANANVTGDQAFSYIGNDAFTGVARQLRYTAGNDTLSGDVDGDGVADFAINVQIGGNALMVAGDFVL